MGPGTHAVERILTGVKPTSEVDAIAQLHDIDFLTGDEPIWSDIKAMSRTFGTSNPNSLQATAMRLGLGARSIFDLIEHVFTGSRLSHINVRTDNIPLSDEALRQLLLTKVSR